MQLYIIIFFGGMKSNDVYALKIEKNISVKTNMNIIIKINKIIKKLIKFNKYNK